MAAASPTLPRRRLSSRRGSMSAPDPYNLNASQTNLSNSLLSGSPCASSSRITIVHVPSPTLTPELTPEPLSRRSSWGAHSRSGSSAGGSSGGGPGSGRGVSPGRLSFAFSSFTPINPTTGSGPSSASGAVNSRPSTPPGSPSSPRFPARRTNSSTSLERMSRQVQLTPQQIYDLAASSLSSKPSAPPTPSGLAPIPAPVPFLPLPDDCYLPFLDRPAEVAALLSTPPTSRLFALLAQTFPVHLRNPPVSPSFPLPSDPLQEEHDFSTDPRTWSFPTLQTYLSTVPRSIASDTTWTRAIRRCVLARSESIWVRLKGALGVPAELEADSEDEGGETDDDGEGEYENAIMSSSSSEDDGMLDRDPNYEEQEEQVEHEVRLEPIFVGSEQSLSSPLVPSLSMPISPVDLPPPGATGLSDSMTLESIGEGEEETPTGQPTAPDPITKTASPVFDGNSYTDIITQPDPPIHALRISTSSSVPAFPTLSRSSSLHTPLASQSQSQLHTPTSSTLGLTAPGFPHRHRFSMSALDRERERERESERERELVRTPGSPLFPGSFARLDVGPTLVTRNPAHRSSLPAPFTRPGYGFSFSRRERRRGVGIGFETDGSTHEYAVSLGSGSERSSFCVATLCILYHRAAIHSRAIVACEG